MTAALRMDGHERKPGHNQVARAMKELGCQAVIRRKSTYRVSLTKGRLADGTVLENTLNRKFTQQEPGKVFVTDVTYIPTKTGWLYLSLVMDLCTREIVVCEMSPCQIRGQPKLLRRSFPNGHAQACPNFKKLKSKNQHRAAAPVRAGSKHLRAPIIAAASVEFTLPPQPDFHNHSCQYTCSASSSCDEEASQQYVRGRHEEGFLFLAA